MRLDRNVNSDGKGKYALINLRKIPGSPKTAAELIGAIREHPGCVEFGTEFDGEFFVIKLKDKYAQEALAAYANAASKDDMKYAVEIERLAARSGPSHPLCKRPD